jgi:hypothetical protein
MQRLSIFGANEGIYFVFQSLEEFDIHLEKFKPTGTQLSATHLPFNRGSRYSDPLMPMILSVTTGDHAHRALESAELVAAAPRG